MLFLNEQIDSYEVSIHGYYILKDCWIFFFHTNNDIIV